MFELDPERYQRLVDARLTRYSREEILGAAQEYETAYAEYCSAVDEAERALRAVLPAGAPLSRLNRSIYFGDWEANLYEALTQAGEVARTGVTLAPRRVAGSGGDLFPLRGWRRAAASCRNAARMIRKALTANRLIDSEVNDGSQAPQRRSTI